MLPEVKTDLKKLKKERRVFSDALKAEVMGAVENRGSKTIRQVAEEFGLEEHLVHSWKARRVPSAPADVSACSVKLKRSRS